MSVAAINLSPPAPSLRIVPQPFNCLLQLVVEATDELQDPTLLRSYGIRPGESYPVRSLLVLLSYCYCNGIYFSRDVEEAARQEPLLRSLFPGEGPDWKALRRFRRVHKLLVQQCLLLILERAFAVRFPEIDGAPTDSCVAEALDKWFEPLCYPFPAREASDRVERAALVDGMLLD